MSFHEKSAWACLVSIVLAYSPYFWMVFQYPLAGLGLFVLAAIALTVLLVVFHIVNAAATRSIRKSGDSPLRDELDRLIELQASKLSGFVLAFFVVAWCITTMYEVIGVSETVTTGNIATSLVEQQLVVSVHDALNRVHILFAGFVIANISYYGCIVLGYRRLARG